MALVSFHDIKEGSLSLLSTVSFLVQTPGSARLVARIHFSRGVWSARLLLRFLLEFFALSLEFSGWVNVISLLSLEIQWITLCPPSLTLCPPSVHPLSYSLKMQRVD